MSLPVAILAGGLATRLRPLTEQIPKILIDVAGRPFAEHQVALLARHGVDRVVFCVGHLGDQVQAALGDGSRWGMRFDYSFDGDRLLGTGGALRQALPLLGDAFFVLYGDSYLDCDYAGIEASFHASGRAAMMTVFRNDDRFDRSNVAFEDGQVVRYDKAHPDAAMHHIDYGLGVLSARVFARWPEIAEPLDLATVYQHLVAAGEMAGVEIDRRFYEIGSHQGLEETRALLSTSMSLVERERPV